MSYFYMKPVQGNISLHILEECVLQRWKYFINSLNNHQDYSVDCQYLIENSPYDNIGHFTLNYLSICSSNQDLINAVINYEETLFYKRLIMGTQHNVRLLCKHILKFTKEIPNNSNISYIQVLEEMCRKLIIKHIASHIINKQHSKQCTAYNIKCHFTMCLSFVKNRQVEIKKGMANIPCGQWMIFFKHLFRTHLNYRNNNMSKNTNRFVDPRCREIILKLVQSVNFDDNSTSILISHKQIDELNKYFPLCMKNLHHSLRIKHRLSHNERFRYSLFLKDIGMPLQQSIYFWQREYSKPSLHHSICCHNWEKDSKKYVYGLRHLYGLEGSRKDYSMAKCWSIQNTTSKEGGCPFKNFDKHKLHKLMDLNMLSNDKLKEIFHFIESKKSSEACTIYKNAILDFTYSNSSNPEILKLKTSKVFSPINYFKEMNSAVLSKMKLNDSQ